MKMPKDEDVGGQFHHILAQRPDIGCAKIISSWFLERPNLFDAHGHRKLKPEILMVLIYVLLMAIVVAAFNVR